MKNLKTKLNLIFIPALLFGFGSILLYELLYWIFEIKLEIVTLGDELGVFVPFGFTLVVLFIFVYPRTKLLKMKSTPSRDPRFVFSFIAFLPLVGVCLLFQNYIEMAEGKITILTHTSDISILPKTKYYGLKKAYFDKSRVAYYNMKIVNGKHNEDLNFCIYTATPIFNDSNETNHTQCYAWLGHAFYKKMDNNISKSDEDTAWHKFFKSSWKEYDSLKLANYSYLMRIDKNDESEYIQKAIENDSAIFSKNVPVLMAENEPFETRYESVFNWLLICSIGSVFSLSLLSFVPGLHEEKAELFRNKKGFAISQESKELFKWIKPNKRILVTQLIIYLNVLIFIMMVINGLGFVSFHSDDLIKWGANFKPLVENGEWWRLVTNIFVHGGIIHLFGNMYGLIIVGVFLEPFIGSLRYLILYLFTGLCASITSLEWHEPIVSVGASGAIFGLYGTFIVLILFDLFPSTTKRSFLIFASIFIGYNLIYGLAGGVDNAAHIGGLLSGMVIGIIMVPYLKERAQDSENMPFMAIKSNTQKTENNSKE